MLAHFHRWEDGRTKQRVGIVSLALLVGAIIAETQGADAFELACLLGLFVTGVAYLVLRIREHRQERRA